MARRQAIEQSIYPYHITARCINQEWFTAPLNEVWEIMSEELYMANRVHGFLIHAFVLMSNHYHLLGSTPESGISTVMRDFMSRTSQRIVRSTDRINLTFAGRHFKSILHSPSYFNAAYKYVYRNPVQAGICRRVEDYPFSTLSGLLGSQKLFIPVTEDTLLFSGVQDSMAWLNEPPDPAKLDAIRQGLKRTYFKSKRHATTNRILFSEHDTL